MKTTFLETSRAEDQLSFHHILNLRRFWGIEIDNREAETNRKDEPPRFGEKERSRN